MIVATARFFLFFVSVIGLLSGPWIFCAGAAKEDALQPPKQPQPLPPSHNHNHSHSKGGHGHRQGQDHSRSQRLLLHPQYSPSSKIAFLFLSRGELPLEDVWRAFFEYQADPALYTIYVHTQPSFRFSNTSLFHGKQIKNLITTKWADSSVVEASKNLYQAALEDPQNEFFCLISESCIPLASFPVWRKHLFSQNLSIVNACPFGIENMEGDTRWRPSLDQAGFKKEHWRKSAAGIALNRKHAMLVANDTALLKAFKSVPCMDEHFVPSLLAYHGLDNETTCTDGFVKVHWESLIAAHPKSFSKMEITPALFDFMQTPVGDGRQRGFNMQCSGIEGLCHFTGRKFPSTVKADLLYRINYILLSDRNRSSLATLPPVVDIWRYQRERVRFNIFDQKYYIIEQSNLRLIPNNETLAHILHGESYISNVSSMSAEEAANYQIGSPLPNLENQQLLKVKRNNQVWITENGTLRWFPNAYTFEAMGFQFANVHTVDENYLSYFVIGPELPDVRDQHKTHKNR